MDSWLGAAANIRGGEIELFILSQHYKVEIVAVEIRSGHLYIYGKGIYHRG